MTAQRLRHLLEFNFHCPICLNSQDRYSWSRLDLAHLDSRQESLRGSDQLIPLCKSCHSEYDTNRHLPQASEQLMLLRARWKRRHRLAPEAFGRLLEERLELLGSAPSELLQRLWILYRSTFPSESDLIHALLIEADANRALGLHYRALDILWVVGQMSIDPSLEYYRHSVLARALTSVGALEEAEPLHLECVKHATDLGGAPLLFAKLGLANLLTALDRPLELRQVVEGLGEGSQGSSREHATSKAFLARVAALDGDDELAERILLESIEALRGDPRGQAMRVANLGEVLVGRGDVIGGQERYCDARSLMTTVGDAFHEAIYGILVAQSMVLEGNDHASALQELSSGIAGLAAVRDFRFLPRALELGAMTASLTGDGVLASALQRKADMIRIRKRASSCLDGSVVPDEDRILIHLPRDRSAPDWDRPDEEADLVVAEFLGQP